MHHKPAAARGWYLITGLERAVPPKSSQWQSSMSQYLRGRGERQERQRRLWHTSLLTSFLNNIQKQLPRNAKWLKIKKQILYLHQSKDQMVPLPEVCFQGHNYRLSLSLFNSKTLFPLFLRTLSITIFLLAFYHWVIYMVTDGRDLILLAHTVSLLVKCLALSLTPTKPSLNTPK